MWFQMSLIPALFEWVDELHARYLEMSPIVSGDRVSVKKGGRRDQGIFASHRPVQALQVRKQLLPTDQYRLGQRLRGGRECATGFRQPQGQSGTMRDRSAIDAMLQFCEGHDTQEDLPFVRLDPRDQLWRHAPSLEQRQQVSIDQ